MPSFCPLGVFDQGVSPRPAAEASFPGGHPPPGLSVLRQVLRIFRPPTCAFQSRAACPCCNRRFADQNGVSIEAGFSNDQANAAMLTYTGADGHEEMHVFFTMGWFDAGAWPWAHYLNEWATKGVFMVRGGVSATPFPPLLRRYSVARCAVVVITLNGSPTDKSILARLNVCTDNGEVSLSSCLRVTVTLRATPQTVLLPTSFRSSC